MSTLYTNEPKKGAMTKTGKPASQPFTPRVNMPLAKQLTITLAALREKAGDGGEIAGAKQVDSVIVAILGPYGANENTAASLRQKLTAYGLVMARRSGRNGIYTVSSEPLIITDELLKQYQTEARAHRKQARKATKKDGSSAGMPAPPVDTASEDPMVQLDDVVRGLEAALVQAVQERDEAQAQAGKEKDKVTRLRQELSDAQARVAELEEQQRRTGRRAAEILERYHQNGTSPAQTPAPVK